MVTATEDTTVVGVAKLMINHRIGGVAVVDRDGRLVKSRPDSSGPAPVGRLDWAVLAITAAALAIWVAARGNAFASWVELAAGVALALRPARWRGTATPREPLLWVLHLGYGRLALGFPLLAFNGLVPLVPYTTARHVLTVGAIGTMSLAVMTRASLGQVPIKKLIASA